MKLLLNKKAATLAYPLSLVLLFLFSLNFVSAEAQTTPSLTSGLIIDYPKFDTLRLNSAFNFSIEVYNISNGVRVTDANCSLMIIDHYGATQLNRNLNLLSTGQYNLFITGGNFTLIDSYSFNTYCVNPLHGGFASQSYEVSPSGRNSLNFYLIVLGLSFLVIIFGAFLADANLTMLGSLGLYFIGIYSLLFGIDAIKNTTYSYAFSFIILALAFYISVKSGLEMIREGN